MGVGGRIEKLERRMGTAGAPRVVVFEAEDGRWLDPRSGEPVGRAALPPAATVIVFRQRTDGRQ